MLCWEALPYRRSREGLLDKGGDASFPVRTRHGILELALDSVVPECDSLAGGVVDGVIGREPEPQFDKVRTGKSHAVLAGVDSLTVGGSGIVIGRVGVGVLFSAKARVCDDQGVALAQVGRLGDLDFRSSYGVGLDGDRCRFSSLDIKGNGIPGEFSVILGEFPAEPIVKVVNVFWKVVLEVVRVLYDRIRKENRQLGGFFGPRGVNGDGRSFCAAHKEHCQGGKHKNLEFHKGSFLVYLDY